MEKQERLKILRSIDLFRSFNDAELQNFAETITELQVEPDTILFEEGSVGRDMFILLEGSLQIYKENRTITTIRPVDYIGEMAIIEDKPRSATVISTVNSHLLKISPGQFDSFFSKQPASLVSMMKTLSNRIRHDTELLAAEFEKANILIHDMRNTVSAFLLLELMHDEPLSEEMQKYIHLMRKSRLDLTEMMEEALANAKRLRHSKHLTNNSLVLLIEELTDSEFSIHPDLCTKKLRSEIDRSMADFPFHRTDIRRVLTNLMINAGQASKDGDAITISLSQSDEHAIVSVTDRGCGIDRVILNKIFLPHFTTKKKGSGLGLASCKEIIETKHGGTLSVKTKKGTGTTFTFTLPFHPPAPADNNHQPAERS